MWTMIALGLATAQANPPMTDDAVLARMTALFDNICLKTFPADDAVAATMNALGAVPRTREQLKIYLHDDPGRGWIVADGEKKFTVTIEAPPYHACTVRRATPNGFADLAPLEAVLGPYERVAGGFAKMHPADMQIGQIASHVVGEQKTTQDGGGEAFYVFSNSVSDPAERAKGYTGVEVRFVHQFTAPGAR
ncbi:MAG: hypothetical protein V4475_21215 [Pseudomonadota bacterium]